MITSELYARHRNCRIGYIAQVKDARELTVLTLEPPECRRSAMLPGAEGSFRPRLSVAVGRLELVAPELEDLMTPVSRLLGFRPLSSAARALKPKTKTYQCAGKT